MVISVQDSTQTDPSHTFLGLCPDLEPGRPQDQGGSAVLHTPEEFFSAFVVSSSFWRKEGGGEEEREREGRERDREERTYSIVPH